MTEEWKTIEDYPNYSVSNLGRVRNDRSGQIRTLHKCGGKSSYLQVYFYQDKYTRKYFLVHRLVATAFIPNPDNLSEVNHIDGNRLNNTAENLEWVSHEENLTHARSILNRKIPTAKKVVRIEDGKVFDSVRKAAYACGINYYSSIADRKSTRLNSSHL